MNRSPDNFDKNRNELYTWIFIAFLCWVSPPVGVIWAALRLRRLWLDGTLRQNLNRRRTAAPPPQTHTQPVRPAREDAKPTAPIPAIPGRTEPTNETLCNLRRVNEEIRDVELSNRIYHIEDLTGKILDCQKNDLEQSARLRTFLNYYLPTTLKLLSSYAELEQVGISGPNIDTSMRRIETATAHIEEGFQTFLDKLYGGDAMDIQAEISALEQMLAQDGLTAQGDRLRPEGSH